MTGTSTSGGTGSKEPSEGDGIKVFVRIRPPDSYETDAGSQHKAVDVDLSGKSIIVSSKPENKVFTFDKVLCTKSTQDEVFSHVGKKIIESCISGYNGTIFAYGQTGSGKTFTMLGPCEDADNFQHELRGVVPRSFEMLFNLVKKEQELCGKEFLLKCSFLEIYHEQVYDLLDPSPSGLHLRESMKKGVYVDGLVEVAVTSASEAYQVLNNGWINRRVASTSMNRESSRSHAVFTVIIESKEKKSGIQKVKASVLNLIDLAGSERQKDTNAVGKRLKEAGSINKSLSVLGNVIMSLVDIAHGKSRFVSYRDSKLTFLLRDSLGGNAKTHIIACVHQGARNFGETYSTLQFARRAKMIKNKAIVNEDMQGDVLSLQAEIRQLKESLRQFQAGNIPPSLDAGENGSDSCNTSADGNNWMEKFFNSMQLLEQSETDKKVLQENISNLEMVSEKKDKFVQSTKMIIKFRENNIQRLEKAVKGNSTPEDIDNRVRDLQAEVNALNKKLEHNPVVAKYAMEVAHLKAELRRQDNRSTVNENIIRDSRKKEDLQTLYRELLIEKQKDSETDQKAVSTPSHTPITGDNIATSTIEKYKSQISNLQKEVSSLKQTLVEQREQWEKKEVELESELKSQKEAHKELSTVLEAHQLKSKLERDVHLQTVKSITTPKKNSYFLRNRVVPISSSKNDDSIVWEDEGGILQEPEPDVMAEQFQEALAEEVKQLQEENNSLTQRIEEYEADAIRLKQHISKIDHQNAHFQDMLDRERNERDSKQGHLDEEINSLKDRAETAEKSKHYLEGEIRDLRILLNSSDKELRSSKEKFKFSEDEFKKNIGSLETKVLKISNEFSKQVKEYENVCEERDSLKENLDNSEETKNFFESLAKELEEKCNAETDKLQKVKKDLENVRSDLAIEHENSKQLLNQLNTVGAAQQEEMLQLMNQTNCLQASIQFEKNRNEELAQNVTLLESQNETLQSKAAGLQKQLEENNDAVANYMIKNKELREQLTSEKENLDDLMKQCEKQKQSIEEQGLDIESKMSEIEELKCKLDQQSCTHNIEMSMVKEDLECVTENCNSLAEELGTSQKNLERSQADVARMREEIETLNRKAQEKEAQYKHNLQEKTDELKEMERRILNEDMQEYIQEMSKLSASQYSYSYKLEDLENSLKERNEEIKMLKDTLVANKSCKEELKKVQFEREREAYLNEQRVSEMKKKMEEKDTLEDHYSNLLKKHELLEACQSQIQAKSAELMNEREQQDKANAALQEEIDRLKLIGTKYYDETIELQKNLDISHEEARRNAKEIQDLKDKLEKISAENAVLSGHQNPKQKIHYTMQIKEENNFLREESEKLRKKYNYLVLKLDGCSCHLKHATDVKENRPPISNMDLNVKQEPIVKQEPLQMS